MNRNTQPRFSKNLLALAIGSALAPHSVWAIDLVQAPPGTVQPRVTPNVIISIDDSGSMDFRVDAENENNASNLTTPNADGSWPSNSRRMNVLKYALRSIFDPTHPKYDSSLLPDKKIRLAWQSMNGNGGTPSTLPGTTGGNPTVATNSIKMLEGTHRTNFLAFVTNLDPSSSTPSHKMFKQADEYMRSNLHKDGPWASVPGTTASPYLGCRRNYHIFMTDGRWNGAVSGGSQDDNTKDIQLPNTTVYGSTVAASRPKNSLYADTYSDYLADWAFASWSKKLQSAVDNTNGVTGLKGVPQPTAEYNQAPATEDFGNDTTGKKAEIERFWNPRYNPANWPHMVTYTIGLSKMAYTWPGLSNLNTAHPPTRCNTDNKIRAPGQTCDVNNNASFNSSLMVPFSYDKGSNGSLPDFITGNIKWPDLNVGNNNGAKESVRSLDLWHAAINGRGRFYAVEKGEDLSKAFRDIFQQINTTVDPDMTSTATSGSNISRNAVGKFTGNYEPKNAWKGFVTAETVRKDGTTVPTATWGGKNTADKLDDSSFSLSSRLVLSWSDQWVTSKDKGGVAFKWASDQTNLSTAQKALLGKEPSDATVTVATNGQNRLNFIRGDFTLQGIEANGYTAAKPFRERKSRQGDIINSVVWYTGSPSSSYALKGYSAFTLANKSRTPMIYVGGNDGLLHGFSATDGSEKIAYAPRGVIASLPQLTDPTYNNKHRFFVDGSPMTGDVDQGKPDPVDPTIHLPDWRTYLVGTMGAGGKGYFVLDVTNPAIADTPAGAPGLTEANAQKLVVLDRTRDTTRVAETTPNCAAMSGAQQTACNKAEAEDKDIGNITARPVLDETNALRTSQIARMNNDRWAVVLGNGYNSTNQRPVLLIQYLDGAKELKRIIAASADSPGNGKAKDNGLAAPRLVDINGDGRPDVVYAGDNLGNLWKFDLTNADDTNWNVAFGGSPLFTAKGPVTMGNVRSLFQPITTAPTIRANDRVKIVGGGASAKTISVGGMMVAFGTGRNVTKADENDSSIQSLYSVVDNTRYRVVNSAKGKRLEVHPGAGTCPLGSDCVPTPTPLGEGVATAKLAAQKISAVNSTYSTVDITDELKKETWNNFNGWYMDLPAVGERLLKPMEFYDGSNILAVYSQVPAKGSDVDPNIETCESNTVDEERQYLTLLNIMDGKRPSVQVMDFDGNGKFFTPPPSGPNPCPTCGDDKSVSRSQVTKGSHTMIRKEEGGCQNQDIDVKNKRTPLACMPEQSLRPSWRQLK
ncbi:MAG: pilus assembly protein PilC [Alcaligenaceae bacterium]|nr:MAG: pilus assembly protein PilC [Alcaligenaceae bacterium]